MIEGAAALAGRIRAGDLSSRQAVDACLVAIDTVNGDLNAVVQLVAERARGRGHIITIDVRELGRRYGIGSALLNSAEQQLRTADCSSIRLETAVDNIGALSFYKRHGYNVIKSIRGYYSTGVDALLLEKDLHSPLGSR